MKKILLIAILLCTTILFPTTALAASNNFVLTSYDVNINVNENNTYNITENITADFPDSSHHGIERFIPQTAEVTRSINGQDETKKYRIIVSDIQASTQMSSGTSDGYYDIRLGDPDTYVRGTQKYTIQYTYDPGDDGYTTFDELYYNIIGTEWAVPIKNATFKITMPKEFDKSKLGFSIGGQGASGFNPADLQVNVSGNVITGKVTRELSPYEGVTTRLELPDGYYVGARTDNGPVMPMVVATLVILGIALLLAALFMRKKKPVQTVEFNPPDDMTSADVGYVIDGIVEDKEVVTLTIYWADTGYLTIHQEEGSKNLTFSKVQELPESANEYEKTMFDGMFASGKTTSIKQLQYKFYETLSAAKEMVKFKFMKPDNLAFNKRSVSLQNLAAFLASLPLAIMTIMNVYTATYEVVAAAIVGMIVLGISVALTSVYIKAIETWFSAKRSTRTGHLIGWAIGTSIFYLIVVAVSLEAYGIYAFLPALAALIITFLAPQFRVWTDKGLEWAGKILGLKNFIQTTELDKLKMMVEENPSYFYRILPYAYVLGVSDKWSKQFESIAIQPPTWYYGYGYNNFSTVLFTSMLINNMMYTQTALMARPNTNSGSFGGGSGFGGGGFSGGGFGGGGGGGW
ncbi:MAG: DUF2207 domain-containing protein [Eubacteriales bacterium]